MQSINPFPHPDNREWHPMAVPFAELLDLVMKKMDDIHSPNQWQDDVYHYLNHRNKNNTKLAEGLRDFANRLEGH